MEDDGWDLQAVVRGCCGPAKLAATTAAVSAGHLSPFPSVNPQESKGEEDDRAVFFPELFAVETATVDLHDLEELCKPFFFESPQEQEQQRQLQQHLSPQRTPPSFPAAPLLPTCALGAPALPVPQPQLQQPQHRPLPQTSRSKRRKNQQKRVMCQVPADGLSSDMWAWRKYGQKPIKGSPYPRGYYRCSSSKGCLARKQVERSRTDPGMFIITYTAEHNHPMPTHRNSLAGSTRQKFPPSAASTQQANPGVGSEPDPAAGGNITSSSPLSSPTAAGLSPTTPLTSSMEDEMLLQRQEDGEEEVEEERGDEGDLLMVGDMEVLGEDDVLFTGLGELRDRGGDDLPDHFGPFPSPWMAGGAATAAGGS